ncbi:MAG: succinate dehydrogenase, hydrophobic membrane anchor protein [Sulfuriflexus sp.]|nr:succinate dehydrogenase, hydrophobic membrane anchor protein [Sulfuriflexus sp.]
MSGVLTGLRAWLLQRASAVYLLLFIVLMPVAVIFQKVDSLDAWQAFIYSPVVTITWILFFAGLFLHAWVGIRDVLVDYVHPFAIRALLLSLLALYLIAMMLWILKILLINTGATV